MPGRLFGVGWLAALLASAATTSRASTPRIRRSVSTAATREHHRPLSRLVCSRRPSFVPLPSERAAYGNGRRSVHVRATVKEPIDKMSAGSIKQELDSLGVTYKDCVEKSDLNMRLLEARSGVVDPAFKVKAEEPIVIEPDVIEPGQGSSSSGYRDSYVEVENDDYSRQQTRSSSRSWGDYPDSREFMDPEARARARAGGAGGSRFQANETEEGSNLSDAFFKEFPEIKRFLNFLDNPVVKAIRGVIAKPFVAIPLGLLATFYVLKFLFLLPTLLFLGAAGAVGWTYIRSRWR